MVNHKAVEDSLELSGDLLTVHDSMLDGLGQLANYLGFSKVMGQLYGALMLNPDPMCLDELMERLSISKASVSMNMRTLEHLGMVRQVWVRGGSGRRKYYEAETDFLQIITNIISSREMRDVERAISVMDENTERLSSAIEAMSEDDKALAKVYMERISQMQVLFRFAQMTISTILSRAGEMDFEDISSIEIE